MIAPITPDEEQRFYDKGKSDAAFGFQAQEAHPRYAQGYCDEIFQRIQQGERCTIVWIRESRGVA
ncbi:MAG: hypothetical protein AAFX78_10100 [Cyanobacteria bacterium J06638_20]